MSEKSRREMMEEFFEPEKHDSGLAVDWEKTFPDGLPHEPRGKVLAEAMRVINGERQDIYGAPERSFERIANYWTEYLGDQMTDRITPQDVAMMMTLFKVAREANQHKRDNIIDAAGYLGIYADMQGGE